jgi:hypothetical protein
MATASEFHPATKVFLIVAAVALVGLVWTRAALTIHDVKPVHATVRPSAVVWSDRVFVRRAPFERWLHARGDSYAAWAQNHRRAAKLLER